MKILRLPSFDVRVIRTIEFLVFFAGSLFSVWWFLDARHAQQAEVEEIHKMVAIVQQQSTLSDLETRRTDLMHELNRDNFARRQYEESIRLGTASERDHIRLEYLLMEIESKVDRLKKIDRQIAKLEVLGGS